MMPIIRSPFAIFIVMPMNNSSKQTVLLLPIKDQTTTAKDKTCWNKLKAQQYFQREHFENGIMDNDNDDT
jgi:hypothetical protein